MWDYCRLGAIIRDLQDNTHRQGCIFASKPASSLTRSFHHELHTDILLLELTRVHAWARAFVHTRGFTLLVCITNTSAADLSPVQQHRKCLDDFQRQQSIHRGEEHDRKRIPHDLQPRTIHSMH